MARGTSKSSGFTGIPHSAVAFYQELALNNSKEWWAAHADIYMSDVKEPLLALLADLEGEFGEAKVFRPHRDVRFSMDKSPYKTHQGAYCATDSATGYYVQIGPEGLLVGGGNYQMATDQLARYRSAVDAPVSGQALQKVFDSLRRNDFEIGGDLLASKPRGFTVDHPRIELLRHKTLVASRSYGEPEWLSTSATATQIRADWRALRPLMQWLSTHVGSSQAPHR